MDLNTIIIIIGFIFLGWYQKYRIDILKAEVTSQRNMIESQSKVIHDAKAFIDLIDLEKIKEYTHLTLENVEIKKNIEIEKLKAEFEKESKKSDIWGRELRALIIFAYDVVENSPPFYTEEAVDKLPNDTLIKKNLLKYHKNIKEIYLEREPRPAITLRDIARLKALGILKKAENKEDETSS
jgi:hypothetical protein